MRFASALHYVILLVFCAFTTVSASSAKAQKLSKLSQSSRNGVVRLNAASFNEYVGPNIPRDYSISVVFNALKPAQGCAPCGLFQREYDLLATQWTRKRPDKKGVPHFFAMVEFTEAQRLFQSVRILFPKSKSLQLTDEHV